MEGDIQEAYPNLDRGILLNILEERIIDKPFLRFMKKRLNLRLFDTKDNKYKQTLLGIPQGGIDSPYLWNIYLLGFDSFIQKRVKEKLDGINRVRMAFRGRDASKKSTIVKNPPVNPIYQKCSREVRVHSDKIKILKKEINTLKRVGTSDFSLLKNKYQEIFSLLEKIRSIDHKKRRVRYYDPNRQELRFLYQRYADDWIIVTNAPMHLIREIKAEIADWLLRERKAILSDAKTLITDMRVGKAHFLGFEFTNSVSRQLKRDKNNKLKRVSGWTISCKPDTARLINRLYMKGYCDKKGFPKEVAWLSTLDLYTIIQRFNSVIRGFANFYAEFISYPSALYRWLYIVKWAAIKTIAQKFKTNISGVFRRFGGSNRRIAATLNLSIPYIKRNGEKWLKEYSKSTYLLKEKEAIDGALALKLKPAIQDDLLKIEKGSFVLYKDRPGRSPRIMDANFLDNINWVNARTAANFHLPCARCGAFPSEMHHIKHVRLRKFSTLDTNDIAGKMLALRNRKQVPLCKKCHESVHTGIYTGPRLDRLFDNRIVNSETFISRAIVPFENLPFEPRLVERNWIKKREIRLK